MTCTYNWKGVCMPTTNREIVFVYMQHVKLKCGSLMERLIELSINFDYIHVLIARFSSVDKNQPNAEY
jgi:hypothetical protein